MNTSKEMVTVPLIATLNQSDGLGRDIVMWWCFDHPTGKKLYQHLRALGMEIPIWLTIEIPDADYVPSKGSVAAAIYRAMIETHLHESAITRPV